MSSVTLRHFLSDKVVPRWVRHQIVDWEHRLGRGFPLFMSKYCDYTPWTQWFPYQGFIQDCHKHLIKVLRSVQDIHIRLRHRNIRISTTSHVVTMVYSSEMTQSYNSKSYQLSPIFFYKQPHFESKLVSKLFFLSSFSISLYQSGITMIFSFIHACL